MYVLLLSFPDPFLLGMHFFLKEKESIRKKKGANFRRWLIGLEILLILAWKRSTTFILSSDSYPVNIQLSLYARDREIVPLPGIAD